MEKINLEKKFALFDDLWSPKLVAQLNDHYVKLARGEGALEWHSHEGEDEMFLVVSGQLDLHLRDRTISLGPGEMFVVPKGVEHRPVASPGTQIVLVEPKETLHTGDKQTEQTVAVEDQHWI